MPIFDTRVLNSLSEQAAGLPILMGNMNESLTKQTEAVQALLQIAEAGVKEPPLVQFLDLTMAQPTLSTDCVLSLVGGWASAAGAVELVLHLGEVGTFFHFWLPPGGVTAVLPLLVEAPWIVARGQRLWVETISQATDFHIKLAAFRS
jgi:hypothetical protein